MDDFIAISAAMHGRCRPSVVREPNDEKRFIALGLNLCAIPDRKHGHARQKPDIFRLLSSSFGPDFHADDHFFSGVDFGERRCGSCI